MAGEGQSSSGRLTVSRMLLVVATLAFGICCMSPALSWDKRYRFCGVFPYRRDGVERADRHMKRS